MKVVRTGCPRPLVVEIEYSSTAHLQPEKVKPLSAETPPDKAGYGRARHRIAADRQAGSLSPHLAPTVTGMTSSLTGTHPRIGGGAPKTVAAEHTFEQLKARTALMDAIYSSAYFWQMATDERGVIQIFNVGAEAMLGYDAVDVVDRITPADISDPLKS